MLRPYANDMPFQCSSPLKNKTTSKNWSFIFATECRSACIFIQLKEKDENHTKEVWQESQTVANASKSVFTKEI